MSAMYLEHFSLSERPFSLTPDTQFFFNKQSHRDALNTILVSVRHSEGFIKIVGEVGTGKTLLCRKLLSMLSGSCFTCYIPNPYLSPDELKAFLASEIRADVTPDMPSHQLLLAIYRRLLQMARKGKQVVLVVDEAQAMPRETIESLRLLTNLETEKRKLLQIVLLGQPELDVLLDRPDLRQLKQRIVFSEYLRPYSVLGTRRYVKHRLMAAGNNAALFSHTAEWILSKASGGVPRLINILAHKALLVAYGKGDHCVKSSHMAQAIRDTSETTGLGKLLALRWHLLWPIVGGFSAAAVILMPSVFGGVI